MGIDENDAMIDFSLQVQPLDAAEWVDTARRAEATSPGFGVTGPPAPSADPAPTIRVAACPVHRIARKNPVSTGDTRGEEKS
ncbi:hypothetical protein GCM10025331_42940 [Actinoplanes utahensis]|nr:hypothetical protein Aut01nite_02850 [Actinoplanes utahensis]